jgi:BCD family chlorophyll transporter-like MFS transporter
MTPTIGWPFIARLGLVQASIGAMVMLCSSLLNRVMVVELGLAAAVPAGLVAWHYTVQLSRPLWGHGSDKGARRTNWIIGGMAVLAFGVLAAVDAVSMMAGGGSSGYVLAILAYLLIGIGVGAAGTSLLAMLATLVPAERRAGAAALTWIMMVAGIAISAGIAGQLLEPFSMPRLALVAGGVALSAFVLTLIALAGLENRYDNPAAARKKSDGPIPGFADALREIVADPQAYRFTLFVFMSMLAYSMQDLILEPFAGIVFAMSPADTTKLSGIQHGGVLVGMILAGVGGSAFAGRRPAELEKWIVAGCLGSGVALVGLVMAPFDRNGWPLVANVVLLGFCNGVFAVAAIGAMMGLAGEGGGRQSGLRMGVWGAAQAVAFALGGLTGAVGVDLVRIGVGAATPAYQLVFAVEAGLFLAAAGLAMRVSRTRTTLPHAIATSA